MTTEATDEAVGARDLEKGLRPTRAAAFVPIATTAIAMLLICNAAGLERWTRELPPGLAGAGLSDRAAAWHRLMVRLGPATIYDALRQAIRKLTP